jgi:Na+/proline symporter
MRAVSYSDVSQFLLMVLALIFLFPYAINYSPNFISKIPRENLTPLTYFHMFPQDAIRWTILLLFLPITSAPLYIRFFASLRDVDRKKALVYSILTYVMADLIILTSGMIAYANSESLGLGDENADIAFIVLGLKILPDALKALFSLGIIAVIIGNTDAWLHSGASSLSYDVLRRLRCIVDDRRLVFYSQFFVFALGAISLVLALYFKDVITAIVFLLTVWTSGILIPTLAVLVKRRFSEKAALASIFAGGLSSLLWGIRPLYAIDPLFIGLFFSITFALLIKNWRLKPPVFDTLGKP